jgi:hypothetical protein
METSQHSSGTAKTHVPHVPPPEYRRRELLWVASHLPGIASGIASIVPWNSLCKHF